MTGRDVPPPPSIEEIHASIAEAWATTQQVDGTVVGHWWIDEDALDIPGRYTLTDGTRRLTLLIDITLTAADPTAR